MTDNGGESNILARVIFRTVQPTDVSRCYQIESMSYPEDEAASKSMLQYRQHHAAPHFRCAFLIGDGETTSGTTSASSYISHQGRASFNPTMTLCGEIIGFVCSTRCNSLTAEAMRSHDATGKILAIHSVVVDERYRNQGVASAMLQDYVSAMDRMNKKRGTLKVKMDKIVLLAKKNLLAFYVRNGFMAIGVSPVVHGKESWFELERRFAPVDDSEAKKYECYLVDSFADIEKQGTGNPAGVVVLDNPPGQILSDKDADVASGSLDEMLDTESIHRKVLDRGAQWMSLVAKEFNQSETAFIWPLLRLRRPDTSSSDSSASSAESPAYAIRYYTRSGVEIELCGHATLAAAFCVLRQKKIDSTQMLSFFAKNDELIVSSAMSSSTDQTLNSDKALRISMNFPWKNVTPVQTESDRNGVISMMSTALFTATNYFSQQEVVYIGITEGGEDLFIEISEESFNALLGVKVNYGHLSTSELYSRGVIICCRESLQSSSIDFRSRFFGPKVGIDEDPVTGSAHCSLGPYFGNLLGKSVVIGRQESDRGGLVECILKRDEGRVCIIGTAVMTVSGKLSMKM